MLLSQFGDLFTNFATTVTGNIVLGEALILATNFDADNFQHAPTILNFAHLYNDAVQLQQLGAAVSQQVSFLSIGVSFAEKNNLVTSPEAFVLDSTVSGVRPIAAQLRNAAQQALADAGAAFFALLGQGPANLATIPTAPSPPPVPTTGGIAFQYYDAPGSASASGPDITESVRVSVSPDSNAPVTVTLKYSATDGTTGGPVTQVIDPDTAQDVSLTVMPCSAGVVGTWTVQIVGYDTHTATTTFTP
jgi:hypothetical protein